AIIVEAVDLAKGLPINPHVNIGVGVVAARRLEQQRACQSAGKLALVEFSISNIGVDKVVPAVTVRKQPVRRRQNQLERSVEIRRVREELGIASRALRAGCRGLQLE